MGSWKISIWLFLREISLWGISRKWWKTQQIFAPWKGFETALQTSRGGAEICCIFRSSSRTQKLTVSNSIQWSGNLLRFYCSRYSKLLLRFFSVLRGENSKRALKRNVSTIDAIFQHVFAEFREGKPRIFGPRYKLCEVERCRAKETCTWNE